MHLKYYYKMQLANFMLELQASITRGVFFESSLVIWFLNEGMPLVFIIKYVK